MRYQRMTIGLLGAFLTASTGEAADAVGLVSYAYRLPERTEWTRDENALTANPSPIFVGETTTLTANPPEKGLAVDYWLVQWKTPSFDYAGEKIAGSDSENPFAWTCNQAPSTWALLAVQYKYLTYDVIYDEVGGSTVADKRSVLYSDSFDLADAPSRAGFTFKGWRDANGVVHAAGAAVTGASFAELDTVHEDGSVVTLTAQWEAVSYALAYDLAGGSAASDYPASAAYDKVIVIASPSRTGYDFAGWLPSGYESTARWGLTDDPQSVIASGVAVGGGADATYFKSLTTKNGGSVSLTAKWQAKTVVVEFNTQGGNGGTSGTRSYTYGSVPFPASVDPPSRSSDTFNGYWTEPGGQGRQLWTATGQWHDASAVWDIPDDNVVVYAAWTPSLTRTVQFDSGFAPVQSVTCTIGAPFGQFFPTITGTNATDVFLGWYSNSTARVEASDLVPGGQYELLLTAHWDRETYYIAFDGNGATDGEMPIMTNKFDAVVSLPSNAYSKTGYTFSRWRDAQDTVSFADGQENLKNILDTGIRQTNTLFAVWQEIQYTIRLDPNGGMGEAKDWQTVSYDEPLLLPTAAAIGYSREPFAFSGWSNAVTGVVYTDLSSPVSKLCAEANGTVTLLAVWRLSDLSVAMDCNNLWWENISPSGYEGDSLWEVVSDGMNTGECAQQLAPTVYPQLLTSSVITNSGTLSFYWKPEGNNGTFLFWIDNMDKPNFPGQAVYESYRRGGTDGEWSFVTTNLVVASGERKYIHLANDDMTSSIRVDLMTWTPGGAREPEAADKVTVSAAGLSADGTQFVLSFTGDSAFDYELLTNADLRVDSWGMMEKKTGADAVIKFEAAMQPELPQLFYKVRTVPKQ